MLRTACLVVVSGRRFGVTSVSTCAATEPLDDGSLLTSELGAIAELDVALLLLSSDFGVDAFGGAKIDDTEDKLENNSSATLHRFVHLNGSVFLNSASRDPVAIAPRFVPMQFDCKASCCFPLCTGRLFCPDKEAEDDLNDHWPTDWAQPEAAKRPTCLGAALRTDTAAAYGVAWQWPVMEVSSCEL
ncbi:hypothetical protein Tsp_12183 [Trichinella spiralis]|uniref:hypothetical protein n=1 Tax=Trichinella spiralis TaxID=6334 RepID=UPI0001EFBE04|nr:hypothetical protein Tsp_12183 [Trichinella spiralis]